MQSLTLSAEHGTTGYHQNQSKLALAGVASPLAEEAPADRSNGTKGAMIGVLLGAGCWTVILAIVAILKS